MNTSDSIRALLVDPSLFVAPYDAELHQGLTAAGVEPRWTVRPWRMGELPLLSKAAVDQLFYRRADAWTFLPRQVRALVKGLSHFFGLARLLRRAAEWRADVVHFQWAVVPALDALAFVLLQRKRPVILTVHDTVPFNGERLSWMQTWALHLPMRKADALIVHTAAGKETLQRQGFQEEKIWVIPHGPLTLQATPSPRSRLQRDARTWECVLCGEIKHYKGADLLVEAVGRLPESVRRQAHFVIAGIPRIDITALRERIAALDLRGCVEIRDWRHSDQEVADLLSGANCIVFPYRQIDASGVYFLVKGLGKWLIATRVGIFAEDIIEGEHGELIPPNDPQALAAALEEAITQRKAARKSVGGPDSWAAIGQTTRQLYTDVLARHRQAAGARNTSSRPARETHRKLTS